MKKITIGLIGIIVALAAIIGFSSCGDPGNGCSATKGMSGYHSR